MMTPIISDNGGYLKGVHLSLFPEKSRLTTFERTDNLGRVFENLPADPTKRSTAIKVTAQE